LQKTVKTDSRSEKKNFRLPSHTNNRKISTKPSTSSLKRPPLSRPSSKRRTPTAYSTLPLKRKNTPHIFLEHAVYSEVCPNANRAGTRGFRAPEVLLKSKRQGPEIDIWSTGVILLCFMSGCHPIFHAESDSQNLAEIAHIVGRKKLQESAAYNARICKIKFPDTSRSSKYPDDGPGFSGWLRSVVHDHKDCCPLHCQFQWRTWPDELNALLDKLLEVNNKIRPSAKDLLETDDFLVKMRDGIPFDYKGTDKVPFQRKGLKCQCGPTDTSCDTPT